MMPPPFATETRDRDGHDGGDENDHVVLCGKPTSAYGRTVGCGRPLGHLDGCGRNLIRGVDRACEECGEIKGCFFERGFARCRACGYPGQ